MANVVEEGTGTAGGALGHPASPARPAPPRWTTPTLNQAWFIGFAPVENPRMAIAVTIEDAPDRPGRHRGRAARQAGARGAPGGGMTEVADDTRRRRPLPDPRPHRLGRDGRRLPGRGHPPRPRGGAQGAAPPLRPGRRVRGALPPRGQGRGRAPAPATSSASTTAASTRAPTTSRWSTCAGARSRTSSTPRRRSTSCG